MSDPVQPLDLEPNEAPNIEPEVTGLRFMLRALKSRNYRLYFFGQGTSVIGTFLTQVAMLWLVHRIDPRPEVLGYVAFAGQLPTFLLPLFSGVWVDRSNRHTLLLVTQTLAMIQSFTLAYVTFAGIVTVPIVVVLASFQGLINAFDIPGRQAFLIELVDDRTDLSNAIALNSSILNAARLIGPMAGGILIYLVGEKWCFFIDGVSYMAVIGSLLAMTVRPRPRTVARKHVLAELDDVVRYALGFPPMRALLLLLALTSISGIPYLTLMPWFAQQVLHGGPRLYGFMQASAGGGALIGAIFLASRRSVVGLGRIIAFGAILFGASLAAFAWSTTPWLSIPLLVLSGFAMLAQTVSTNTMLQTLVEDDMRGRIMSLFTIAFIGMTPWGNLIYGKLSKIPWLGPQRVLTLGGICCALGGAGFFLALPGLRKLVRPIYVKRGIIPEIAAGMNAAAELRLPPED